MVEKIEATEVKAVSGAETASASPKSTLLTWSSAGKWGKRILMGVGGLTLATLFIGIALDSEQSGDQSLDPRYNVEIEGDDADQSRIVGKWISTDRGGEDGLTDCAEALSNEHFITRQGKFAIMRFNADGSYGQFLSVLKLNKKYAATGTYEIKNRTLRLVNEEAVIGDIQSDLENTPVMQDPGSTSVSIHFVSPNVMIHSGNDRSDRLVRCGE